MAILTKDHSVNIANNFISDLESLSDSFYVFFGYTTPWPVESAPPTINNSYNTVELTFYNNLTFGKKITSTDCVMMAPNYTWQTNTVFTQFDQADPNIFTENFYCVTNQNQVYKCIYNNNGSPSTSQPALTSSSFFTGADGYMWKYLYTIDPVSYSNFYSNNYIPVVPNTSVTSAAIPGAIPAIQVTNSGSQYICYNNDQLQNVVNNTVLILGPSANGSYGTYNNCAIYINSGTSSGQIRTIQSYDGSTKTATLDSPLNFSVAMQVSNTIGTFPIGSTVTQTISTLQLTSGFGSGISVGANLIQSDSGAFGYVTFVSAANSVGSFTATVINSSNISFQVSGANGINYGISSQTNMASLGGTISVTGNTVTGTNTAFSSIFLGTYLRPSTYPSEWRKVASVTNATSLQLSAPFTSPITNSVYTVLADVSLASNVVSSINSGTVNYSNFNSELLNLNTVLGTFILGEAVIQSGTGANGIVSFTNSSVIMVNLSNSSFTSNSQIVGISSNATANIVSIAYNSYISITSNNTFLTNVPIFNSATGGSATLVSLQQQPTTGTDYIVSPKVTITGDGTGCRAYSVINSHSNSISGIVCVNVGSNYTYANVSITNYPSYGSGASARALLSPVTGHGSNVASEIGANYVGIYKLFSNTTGESHALPAYGSYRQVGILKNPLFNDVSLSVNNYLRYTLGINPVTPAFSNGDIVLQSSTNAGAIVSSYVLNSANLELKLVTGTFAVSNSSNSSAINDLNKSVGGFISNTTVTSSAVPNYFNINSNNQVVSQANAGQGTLVSANSSTVNLTNVKGTFSTGNVAYDLSTNAYANVVAINTANNTRAINFQYFNQIVRLPLSSNVGAFIIGEIVTQATTNATGTILYYGGDTDIALSSSNGVFSNGEIVTQSTPSVATGVVIRANSSYVQIKEMSGQFNATSNVSGQSTTTGTISSVYPVLILNNVRKNWINSNNVISGSNSAASGFSNIANTIIYPDLVRNSGDVIYIENITPASVNVGSTEAISLVIKF